MTLNDLINRRTLCYHSKNWHLAVDLQPSQEHQWGRNFANVTYFAFCVSKTGALAADPSPPIVVVCQSGLPCRLTSICKKIFLYYNCKIISFSIKGFQLECQIKYILLSSAVKLHYGPSSHGAGGKLGCFQEQHFNWRWCSAKECLELNKFKHLIITCAKLQTSPTPTTSTVKFRKKSMIWGALGLRA